MGQWCAQKEDVEIEADQNHPPPHSLGMYPIPQLSVASLADPLFGQPRYEKAAPVGSVTPKLREASSRKVVPLPAVLSLRAQPSAAAAAEDVSRAAVGAPPSSSDALSAAGLRSADVPRGLGDHLPHGMYQVSNAR